MKLVLSLITILIAVGDYQTGHYVWFGVLCGCTGINLRELFE
jgi:hypothetical protein